MKRNKGISLIVLVITIIVMIILATSVVLILSNANTIDKAGIAVDLTNEKQVQNLSAIIWSRNYVDGLRENELVEKVEQDLANNGIHRKDWLMDISNRGIAVSLKDEEVTLGELVTSAKDYGKTINYSANGVSEWKVFYKNEECIYLIASEKLEAKFIPSLPGATVKEVTVNIDGEDKVLGDVYWENETKVPSKAANILNATRWMAEWGEYDSYETNINGRCVSYFLDETYWTNFKNNKDYGEYVIGAIGTPTLEMYAKSWNEKRDAYADEISYEPKLILTNNADVGYSINGEDSLKLSPNDELYIWSTLSGTSTAFASPSGCGKKHLLGISASGNISLGIYYYISYGLRPVICLDSRIPAAKGITTDFII
ncbi:MAG: hypothetical protein IKL68_02370 [Clostridia bacterium]|nr:hypothetical protein [Clostridia bacterium]